MPTRPYKTWVEVSLSALQANAAAIKGTLCENVQLMAIVKSNAYGHGTTETVRALERSAADWFGVDSLHEAEVVRAAGSKKPVLIMGYTPPDNIARTIREGFSFTAYDPETIRLASRAATAKKPAKLHLKIETGTSRQGVDPSMLPKMTKALKRARHVIVEGISTHYANIEDTTDSSYAMGQLAKFARARATLAKLGHAPTISHTAASAAALLYPQTHFDAVRIGIALYGLWPSKETRVSSRQSKRTIELIPALTWKSVVAQVKTIPAGTPVSYGLTERVTRRSKIAVIPVGYWDGYGRTLSSVGRVLIRGRRAKVLGRVCMNMFVVDVTDIPGVKTEDEVVLLGRQGKDRISAEDLAAAAGTINYEIVTRINPLIPRVATR